ncbi:MAG: hypothetical protein J7K72_01460 [Candidatus Aenigmarchaeota archaeon]|nr:hypothetical protein [Candidatus Aenigmarchaeota archaeon]
MSDEIIEGYRELWESLEEKGYRARAIYGGNVELRDPNGRRIGVYHVPERLEESLVYIPEIILKITDDKL